MDAMQRLVESSKYLRYADEAQAPEIAVGHLNDAVRMLLGVVQELVEASSVARAPEQEIGLP